MKRFRRSTPDPDPPARSAALEQRVAELEQQLDRERLRPELWANRRIRDRFGNAVHAGPFAGLAYPEWGLTEVDGYAAKVLGSYEAELHDALEAAIAQRPARVVDVGTAEGYYVVGLARRLPEATVVGFEIVAERVEQLRTIAELNGVAEQVDARAVEATAAALAEVVTGPTLLVCDCEGAEATLLDPAAVPGLAAATMLVETHDHVVPGVTDDLAARFAASHTVERIASQPRFADDHPETDFLPLTTRELALSERRAGPQQWLVLVPRAS
ncbi:methyltransferase domain-containing protein [Patulibacter defluvii]|uniref:methyltransferase domain-containing protein n=1 Tax=Patulibacter defluvii TaxID=3095358 RepID=UPI002A76385C|nr:methyltransferase domain-containing protein [Patulibacter sp. DM4]